MSIAPPQRAAYVLHDVAELSVSDTARALGLSLAATRRHINAVRVRIHRHHDRPPPRNQLPMLRAFAIGCRFRDGIELAVLLDPMATAVVDGGGALRVSERSAHGWGDVHRLVCTLFAEQKHLMLVEHAVNGRTALLAVLDREVVAMVDITVRRRRIRDVLIVLNPAKLRQWNG